MEGNFRVEFDFNFEVVGDWTVAVFLVDLVQVLLEPCGSRFECVECRIYIPASVGVCFCRVGDIKDIWVVG